MPFTNRYPIPKHKDETLRNKINFISTKKKHQPPAGLLPICTH